MPAAVGYAVIDRLSNITVTPFLRAGQEFFSVLYICDVLRLPGC